MNKYIKISTSILMSSILFGTFIMSGNYIDKGNSINLDNDIYKFETRKQKEYKDINLNTYEPDSEDQKFNTKKDREKYQSVTYLNEKSFGNGYTYELKFNLAEILGLTENSWISQVSFDKNDRFDFYRTIQLTDNDFWSGDDYHTSGQFWSSEGLDNEDTWSGINKQTKGYTYTFWNEMSSEQKKNQAPYVGTGLEGGKENIVIHSGETKKILHVTNGPDTGIPCEYYNKYDLKGKGDGWINETGLDINARLDNNSTLTLTFVFSRDVKKFDGNRSKNYFVHLPKIDVIEVNDYIDGNATANQTEEFVKPKETKKMSDRYILEDKPIRIENLNFSDDSKWHERRVYYIGDQIAGEANFYYEPSVEKSRYNPETGTLIIGWDQIENKTSQPIIPYNHTDYYNYYSGEVSYNPVGEISTGKYDFSNLFVGYSKEQLEIDLLNNLVNYNSDTIIGGVASHATTYAELDFALRGQNNIKQIPLSEGTDIIFYDAEYNHLITDYNQHLESGNFKVKFESNGLNENIVGDSEWMDLQIPFIYE